MGLSYDEYREGELGKGRTKEKMGERECTIAQNIQKKKVQTSKKKKSVHLKLYSDKKHLT